MKLPVPMVFKGGTSLSKCYKLINRFSEDLDITLDYRGLKPLDLPIESYSRSFLKGYSNELKRLLREYVYETILPGLDQKIRGFSNAIKIEVDRDGEEVRIYYPSVLEQQGYYLASSILIEFGGRNVTEPGEQYVVEPYLADHVNDLELPKAIVDVLSVRRTFWEKVTLIHVESHRRRLGDHPDHMSRHWYDLAMLFESPIAEQALSDVELMADVIKHKQAFFNASYANYKKCLNKQFQIVPHLEDLEGLEKDFKSMLNAGMFYGEDPDFAKIIEILRGLEKRLNE